jgi:oligoendopeptidase F
MSGTTTISKRDDIPVAHTWDLSVLFPGEKAWEEELKEYEGMIPQVEKFKDTLGTSAQDLKKCLDFMNKIEILEERLGHYAFLRTAEDAGNSDHQGRFARFMAISSKAHAEASYQTPEIQAIPDDTMEEFLKSDSLVDFEITLRKILHLKPHVLSADEERLLALQAESAQTPTKAFGALTDVDLDFGTIEPSSSFTSSLKAIRTPWQTFMPEVSITIYTSPGCGDTKTPGPWPFIPIRYRMRCMIILLK